MEWLKGTLHLSYAAAVEISAEAANRASRVFNEVEVSKVEEAKFAFQRDQFDLVLALDVLEHLEEPEATLRKLHDKLRPGGTILASIPNVAHYEVAAPLFWRGQWDYGTEGLLDRTHLRFFTESSAIALLDQAGFEIQRIAYVRRFPNVFAFFGLRTRKWRWYSNKLLGHILIWPKHLFVYQFIIRAQPK